MVPTKFIRAFTLSVGMLLLITAIAKLASSNYRAQILTMPDPVFGVEFKLLFRVVGGMEFLVAIYCFFQSRSWWPVWLVAWLSTMFLGYRIGLLWVGYNEPCPCLGSLTGAIHLDPGTADLIMKVILGYMMVGSYGILIWKWVQTGKGSVSLQYQKCP